MIRRGHALGAARNLDGIRIEDADALQKFPESQFKAVVEAPQDGCVTLILVTRSIKVEDLFHNSSLTTRIPSSHLTRVQGHPDRSPFSRSRRDLACTGRTARSPNAARQLVAIPRPV